MSTCSSDVNTIVWLVARRRQVFMQRRAVTACVSTVLNAGGVTSDFQPVP
jgi:hypothetical protein